MKTEPTSKRRDGSRTVLYETSFGSERAPKGARSVAFFLALRLTAHRGAARVPYPSRRVRTYRRGLLGWIAFDAGGVALEMGLPGTPVPVASTLQVPDPVPDLVLELEDYWTGGPLPKASALLIERAAGTRLQSDIYEIVAGIPRGKTLSYAEVAAAAGRPGVARAVGAAMARNPFAPVIPCHRVVGSHGQLTGYGGGLAMKCHLLEMEGAGG